MGIITDIQRIGKSERNIGNLERRVLKAGEELGELNEAVLSITSASNSKGKSYMDVVEEAVDVTIMGLDIAMTKPPGMDKTMTDKMWRSIVQKIFAAKLNKWRKQVEEGRTLVAAGEIEFDENELGPYLDRKAVLLSDMIPPPAEDAITRKQADAIATDDTTWLANWKRVREGYVDPMTDREFANQIEMEEDAGLHE